MSKAINVRRINMRHYETRTNWILATRRRLISTNPDARTQINVRKEIVLRDGDKGFTVDLRDQWYLQGSSPVDPNGNSSPLQKNPDPSRFDGVYASYGHWNQGGTIDVLRITLFGYTTFRLYIRSDSETNCDCVTVGYLDQQITSNPGTNGKATTYHSGQQSGQELEDYDEVVFTSEDGLTRGIHFIDVCYLKDGGINTGNDRGYVLIPKDQ